jgi:hypothetical protein
MALIKRDGEIDNANSFRKAWNRSSPRRRSSEALGRPSGARFRTYERLKRYADEVKDTAWYETLSGMASTQKDDQERLS